MWCSMERSTKDVILGCLLTAALSIPLSILGTKTYYNSLQTQGQEQEQNQSMIINIGGTEMAVNAQNIEELYSKVSNLESENSKLQDQIEKNNNNIQIGDDADNEQYQNEIIYLNELPFFNCQFYSDGDGAWTSSSIPEWNIYEDRTADGKNHSNAIHMTVNTDSDGAQMYVIDYLLDAGYTMLNGSFMLDEISKSTTSEATLKIYGDDVLLYECAGITGGFIPQNTGNISIDNVKRLRFEFSSNYGSIGNYSNHKKYFGVVFYDTFLKRFSR